MFHPGGPTLRELAVQALSSTQRGYDLLAPKFDYTPFRTPDAVLEAVAARLEPAGPFGEALDLCCGTGADFSRGMLLAGRRALSGAPEGAPLSWVRGDALALPFGPAFDLVVSFGAFGHFLRGDQPQLVAEVARVLRPGGRFAFVTAEVPRAWSARWWLGHAFNGVMRVRNLLVSPPFVMYYLTFLLPDALPLLEEAGLTCDVRRLGAAPGAPGDLRLVTATRDS
jgi:SAM-dependent methyltransferase